MLPLSPGDLHEVAKALETIEFNKVIVSNPLIGRIEVYRPDGDDVIGYFESAQFGAEDDWYGFVPLEKQGSTLDSLNKL